MNLVTYSCSFNTETGIMVPQSLLNKGSKIFMLWTGLVWLRIGTGGELL
jgi:hypothetical protein